MGNVIVVKGVDEIQILSGDRQLLLQLPRPTTEAGIRRGGNPNTRVIKQLAGMTRECVYVVPDTSWDQTQAEQKRTIDARLNAMPSGLAEIERFRSFLVDRDAYRFVHIYIFCRGEKDAEVVESIFGKRVKETLLYLGPTNATKQPC